MKKIVIFGATGMTGLETIKEAIKKGLEVTAFVRDERRLPSDLKNKLAGIKIGDVTNPDQVSDAVAGQDGVVVTLGTRNDYSPTTVLSDGTRNIVEAMKKHNVEVVSVLLSYYHFFPPETVPSAFRELNNEHERQYQATKNPGVKWIAVMAPYILNKPKSKYVVTFDKSAGDTISKPDLAEFLLDSLNEPKYYQKTVGLANV